MLNEAVSEFKSIESASSSGIGLAQTKIEIAIQINKKNHMTKLFNKATEKSFNSWAER